MLPLLVEENQFPRTMINHSEAAQRFVMLYRASTHKWLGMSHIWALHILTHVGLFGPWGKQSGARDSNPWCFLIELLIGPELFSFYQDPSYTSQSYMKLMIIGFVSTQNGASSHSMTLLGSKHRFSRCFPCAKNDVDLLSCWCCSSATIQRRPQRLEAHACWKMIEPWGVIPIVRWRPWLCVSMPNLNSDSESEGSGQTSGISARVVDCKFVPGILVNNALGFMGTHDMRLAWGQYLPYPGHGYK